MESVATVTMEDQLQRHPEHTWNHLSFLTLPIYWPMYYVLPVYQPQQSAAASRFNISFETTANTSTCASSNTNSYTTACQFPEKAIFV